MTHDNAFPFLTVLVLLPAGGALAAAAMPDYLAPVRHQLVVKAIGYATTLATLALAVTIAVRYQAGNGGFRLVSDHQWIPQLGISWHLGVDGISLFLVLMAALLFPLVLLAGGLSEHRGSVAWLLLLEAGCLGSFVALDLILFFLFFELTLVPVYFLMTGWGYANRNYAAIKFFLYTFLGSAFLLVGIVAVAFIHERQTGHLSFDLLALTGTHLGTASQVILFLAFTAAFAVKAPVFPFHTWSPDAYAEAPTGASVVLAAVMAKMGTYGIIRFDLTLFPRAVVDLAPLLLTLGLAGILYGALVACATRDLKRLVAYSSLAHLGFVVLGTFALTTQGLTGGVVQMVNHGLIIAVLFICIGWIYDRRGTWNTKSLRGLQRPAPVLAGAFTVAMMAALGLPGLNGFVGEFLVLIGTFSTHRWWAVAATFGVVLAALYLLWAYQQAFHLKPDEANVSVPDLSWRETSVVVPLVLVIAFLGIYPKPVLDRITPSVDRLVQQVDAATGTREPSVDKGPAASYTSTVPATASSVHGDRGAPARTAEARP
ncbi:MAG TPA: NADH-quinone oxidoreductase subunit M [Acidimicrobiales bacterium]|nr:NADH-quinone oxidoreductase subunit M [Acidimicrobiales bacterium]